jgi:hypothetical protein
MATNAHSEYLFGNTRDMYDPFKPMVAMGLRDKAFPHTLRQSRATHLQDGTISMLVAPPLENSIQTVERVYGHHSADLLARTVFGAG